MSAQSVIEFNPELIDVDEGRGDFVLLTIFIILITLSTGTRLATKFDYRLKHGVDDLMILVALVRSFTIKLPLTLSFFVLTLACQAVNLAANIMEYQSLNDGFGRHLQFLSSEQAHAVKKSSEITILLANISLWAVKISVCFYLLSLIQNAYRRAHWVIYSLAAITTTASNCQAIFWGLQAKPLGKLWDPEIPGTLRNTETLVITIITFTGE